MNVMAGDGVLLDSATAVEQAWTVLAEVLDPEVPALSICDLGIVRDVCWVKGEGDGNRLEIVLTPTYSGCPATEMIEQSVLAALDLAGLGPATVRLQRAPAWTTDWLSEAGRQKLKAYGIAPPGHLLAEVEQPVRFIPRQKARFTSAFTPPLACPRCDSTDTEMLSAFGSTACKSLHRCMACKEPFEHFKPI